MIFWFSGTGNSKWVAEKIANETSDRVISIPDAIRNGNFSYTLSDGERIGWVFPVHAWGVPRIVLSFIAKFNVENYKDSTYCYMVCTCGDDCGLTFKQWQKAIYPLRGDAGFSLQMPNTYICLPGFDVDSDSTRRLKLKSAPRKLQEIIYDIAERRCSDTVFRGQFASVKSSLLRRWFNRYLITDNRFTANDDCSSCGLCASLCPTDNITLASGKPSWGGNCTMCLGCLHRCPHRAINWGKATMKKGRYIFSE